jgi:hypothetical protein
VKQKPTPWRLTKPEKPEVTPQRIEALAEWWAKVVDPNFLYLVKQLKANAGTWRNFGRVIEATEEKKGNGAPAKADDIWLLCANAVRQPGETRTESIRRMRGYPMKTSFLSFRKARDAMGKGAVLVDTHSPRGVTHYVEPGGPVDRPTAEAIKKHPMVRAQWDALFPQMSQTWRMLRN